MAELEKVIKGLECCTGQCNYHGCPYKDPCENSTGVKQIMLDALELLKKQSTGKWIYEEDETGHDGYTCSVCGFFEPWYCKFNKDINFIRDYKHCPNCSATMEMM